MREFMLILPEEQQTYLDDGWTIVGPGKVHGGVWSVIVERKVQTDES